MLLPPHFIGQTTARGHLTQLQQENCSMWPEVERIWVLKNNGNAYHKSLFVCLFWRGHHIVIFNELPDIGWWHVRVTSQPLLWVKCFLNFCLSIELYCFCPSCTSYPFVWMQGDFWGSFLHTSVQWSPGEFPGWGLSPLYQECHTTFLLWSAAIGFTNQLSAFTAKKQGVVAKSADTTQTPKKTCPAFPQDPSPSTLHFYQCHTQVWTSIKPRARYLSPNPEEGGRKVLTTRWLACLLISLLLLQNLGVACRDTGGQQSQYSSYFVFCFCLCFF